MTQLIGHERPVTCCAFSPDGGTLVTGSQDMTVRVWDLQQGRQRICLRGQEGGVLDLAVSPDGRFAASVGNELAVRIWDLTRNPAPESRSRHAGRVISVEFSFDGRRLASISEWGEIVFWEMPSCGEIRRSQIPGISPMATVPPGERPNRKDRYSRKMTFRRDGRLLVPTFDCQLLHFDGETGEPLGPWGETPFLTWGLALTPDGSSAALGSSEGDVVLWRPDYCRTLARLPTAISSLAFSPDGQTLACGGDGRLDLLDVSTGDCLASLDGHKDVVWRSTFTPGGGALVTTCWDHVTRVWNWKNASCEAAFPGRGDPAAIANGVGWRGFWRGTETLIERTDGECVAWLPVPLRDLQAHPSERYWAGCSGQYVIVFEVVDGMDRPSI